MAYNDDKHRISAAEGAQMSEGLAGGMRALMARGRKKAIAPSQAAYPEQDMTPEQDVASYMAPMRSAVGLPGPQGGDGAEMGGGDPSGVSEGHLALLAQARQAHRQMKPKHKKAGAIHDGMIEGSPFSEEAKFRAWYGRNAQAMGLHPDPEKTGVDMRRIHKLSMMSGRPAADVMIVADQQKELLNPQDQAIGQYFSVGRK